MTYDTQQDERGRWRGVCMDERGDVVYMTRANWCRQGALCDLARWARAENLLPATN
jgi:hypothetical protein